MRLEGVGVEAYSFVSRVILDHASFAKRSIEGWWWRYSKSFDGRLYADVPPGRLDVGFHSPLPTPPPPLPLYVQSCDPMLSYIHVSNHRDTRSTAVDCHNW